jgi:glucosylceramidase
MNSRVFSLGNYAHISKAGDAALGGFSIARNRQALLPFIQAALAAAQRRIELMVSPWSLPAWMKSKGQMNHGGYLLPEFHQA